MKSELNKMCAYGQSKHLDKLTEKATGIEICKNKIYSFSTMKAYQKHLFYFLRDMQKKHKEVRSIADCEKYVAEWINGRIGAYSPFTLKMELSAIAKLYHKAATDFNVEIPQRSRNDIRRSRGGAVRDENFSMENNKELLAVLKISGMRRREVSCLKPEWLFEKDGHYYLKVTAGAKGGRPRTISLLQNDKEVLKIALEKIKSTSPGHKVFPKVNTAIDVHHFRHQYVKMLYKQLARSYKDYHNERQIYYGSKLVFTYNSKTHHAEPKEAKKYYNFDNGIPVIKSGYKDVSSCYYCRYDDRFIKKPFDREALRKCSEAVGHSRVSVTMIYLTS